MTFKSVRRFPNSHFTDINAIEREKIIYSPCVMDMDMHIPTEKA